jgi:nucleoside-diphosphate-sugar epimerase
MSRKICISGALGFQGTHITTALLARGDTVTALSTPSLRNREKFHHLHDWMALAKIPPPRLHVVMGSVADAEILEKTLPGHDALIHLAAWTSVDASLDRPWPPFEINALGTLALLEACRRFGDKDLKLIIASSCEVYGPTTTYEVTDPITKRIVFDPGINEQKENWPLLPRSPYAASKVAADRMAYAYAVTYDLDVTILRPCNIYGPGQRAGAMGAVIPSFTKAALASQPLVVTGGGQQFREFLHVDDLVRAYLAVLDGPPGEPGATYNVGSGETRTVLELATMIQGWTGWPGPKSRIDQSAARVADVSGFLLDSSRFRGTFPWKPTVAFIDGLRGYLEWARARQAKGDGL